MSDIYAKVRKELLHTEKLRGENFATLPLYGVWRDVDVHTTLIIVVLVFILLGQRTSELCLELEIALEKPRVINENKCRREENCCLMTSLIPTTRGVAVRDERQVNDSTELGLVDKGERRPFEGDGSRNSLEAMIGSEEGRLRERLRGANNK